MVADKDLQSIAVISKFGSVYWFWGKCAGRFFRPAPAFGYGPIAPTPAHDTEYRMPVVESAGENI